MSHFTRQDFQLIAEIIQEIDSKDDTQQYVAELFASRLTQTNPNFDRERFIDVATGERER